MNETQISRYISLILRHKPETIGITLDEHGWADVDALIEGIGRTKFPGFDMPLLEKIVAEDGKQRYSFNDTKTLIRANQGHSVPVDVELEKVQPPEYLYHGTAERFTGSIEKEGLKPMGRLYVHLSPDSETAVNVGKRHGKPIVYRISAELMAKNGFEFFRSANGVWLTRSVPAQYLERNVENLSS